jgi:general secretion pathway protein G
VELRSIAARIGLAEEEGRVLPSSLADVGITTLDPWGSPYQYLLLQGQLPAGMADGSPDRPPVAAGLPSVQAGGSPGAGGGGSGGDGGGGGGPSAVSLARKDRFLVPINSDFDLYSMGPDGRTQATLNAPVSRDDVIRAANGAYYGLAEKF